jgi:hypothetical protein
VIESCFHDLVTDLREIWEKFFAIRAREAYYQGRGERIVLPVFMFKYYDETGFLQELCRLIVQIFHAPNFSVEKQRLLLRPSEIRTLRAYEYEIYERAKRGEDVLLATWESRLTTATPENQFIAVFLEILGKHLANLIGRLDKTIVFLAKKDAELGALKECPNYERPITQEVKRLKNKAQSWLCKFSGLRRLGFLAEISQDLPMPLISERMLNKPLYRKVWESYRAYSRSLLPQSQEWIELAFLADWRIYELWLLFRVRDIVRAMEGREELVASSWETDKMEPVLIDDDGRANDVFNRHLLFAWKNISLHYQMAITTEGRKYRAVTQNVRPDIVLERDNELVILDAKHKSFSQLSALPEEDEPAKAWNPKSDWEQMHVYRDNIRLQQTRPVQMALLVFSGAEDCKESKLLLPDAIKDSGLGAIRVATRRDVQKLRQWLEG